MREGSPIGKRARALWLVALFALLPSTAHGGPRRSALVLPPVGIAVDEAQRDGVAAAIRQGLGAFDLTAMSLDETRGVLRDLETMGVACNLDAVECILQIGGIASVDVVLAGLVSPREQTLVLDLLAVDIGTGTLRGRSQAVLPLDGGTRSRELEGGLAAILRPEVWRGAVTLIIDRPGAQVVVDGVARGFSPLKRPLSLSPGRHELFVGLEGFRPHRDALEVTYRGQATVRVSLVPGPSEPPPLRAVAAPVTEPVPPVTTAATPSPGPRRTLRVALYEPSVAGVAPRVVGVMQDYLAAEIRKREKVSVLGTEELRSFLQQSAPDESAAGCTQDQCLADVAAALGVDVVVLSQFTEVGGELFFGLRRIDQDRQEVVGSYSARIAADDLAALLPHVGASVAKTFADVPLRNGETEGVSADAARRLTPPPLPPAAPIGLAVGGGALLVGSATLFGWASWTVAHWNGAIETARKNGTTLEQTFGEYAAAKDGVGAAEATAWVALLAGVFAGVGAGVATQFTDWEGLAEEARRP